MLGVLRQVGRALLLAPRQEGGGDEQRCESMLHDLPPSVARGERGNRRAIAPGSAADMHQGVRLLEKDQGVRLLEKRSCRGAFAIQGLAPLNR